MEKGNVINFVSKDKTAKLDKAIEIVSGYMLWFSRPDYGTVNAGLSVSEDKAILDAITGSEQFNLVTAMSVLMKGVVPDIICYSAIDKHMSIQEEKINDIDVTTFTLNIGTSPFNVVLKAIISPSQPNVSEVLTADDLIKKYPKYMYCKNSTDGAIMLSPPFVNLSKDYRQIFAIKANKKYLSSLVLNKIIEQFCVVASAVDVGALKCGGSTVITHLTFNCSTHNNFDFTFVLSFDRTVYEEI